MRERFMVNNIYMTSICPEARPLDDMGTPTCTNLRYSLRNMDPVNYVMLINISKCTQKARLNTI